MPDLELTVEQAEEEREAKMMTKKWLWVTIPALALCTGWAWAETVYSDDWEPPRLVNGMWVTSGVADNVAKEYAEEYNKDKTPREIREQEWAVHWQWYWDEPGAPDWALEAGMDAKQFMHVQLMSRLQGRYPCPASSGSPSPLVQAWGYTSYGYWPGIEPHSALHRLADLLDDPWATDSEIGRALLDVGHENDRMIMELDQTW